jgi:hypothetical protein
MRIAILGGCQAHGYAHALMQLLPEAEVDSFEAVVVRHHNQVEAVGAALAGYDWVFTQDLDPSFGPLGTAALQAARPRVQRIPLLAFGGYQPDLVYLSLDGQFFSSPLGAYHSAIIAAAFSLGVAEADVPQLFNRMVYQRLGYFEAFGKARTLLLQHMLAGYGLDLTVAFDRWNARGCFMHTVNHPKAFPLADLAHAAAVQSRLVPPTTPVAQPAFDHLANDTIWPVYPELAEALGVPGSLCFKRVGGAIGPGANSHVIGLPRLIRESYTLYPGIPEAAFHAGEAGALRQALAALLD